MKAQANSGIKALVTAMYKADAVHGKSALAVLKAYNAFLVVALAAPMTKKALAEVCDLITSTYRSMEAEGKAKIAMFRNAYVIAHGKEATRDTPQQAAQGFKAVQAVIDKCATITELKRELPHAKLVKHGATGAPKLAKAKAKGKATKPVEMKAAQQTRPEAVRAVLGILKAFNAEFLSLANAKDLPIMAEVDKLVALLKAA